MPFPTSEVFAWKRAVPDTFSRLPPKREIVTSTNANSIRILLADDHILFRNGLRALLNANAGLLVVAEAGDDASTVRLTRECKPNVLLLDWEMSRRDGMKLLKELAAYATSVCVLLIKVPTNAADVAKAIQLGVKGILSGETTEQLLCEGICKVMDGQYVLGRVGVASLVGTAIEAKPSTAFQSAKRKFGITRREFEVISHVVEGYSPAEICLKLSVRPNTLKHHMSHIFNKVGVSNRLELVLFAINHNLVPDSVGHPAVPQIMA
jgi:two-component system nitrate/nitrite response regulator NarL